MKGFIAALYKDMKLMLNGTGLITLLFSLILLPLFWWGTKDLSAADVVRPFPIAIRDLDETVMSRSLISQIGEIELFSEVRAAGSDSSDGEILSTGVAGIVTIPKDFFYAMYRGDDAPVILTLNENMQLQAALLQSVFTSVMDIISADQSAWRGVYAYVYGKELTGEQQEQLYEDASKDLFTDALSRQQVFENALSGSDMLGVFRRRLAAVLLMMLSILFTLSALKTLPQEWNMGALIRYKAMGASLGGFIFSKLLTCIFWMLPMAVLLFFLSGLSLSGLSAGLFALLSLAMLLASFGINLFFVAVTGVKDGSSDGSSDGASGLSNMYLLLSLFFGGTLLSVTLLSERFAVFQKLIAGAYVLPVLNAMDAGESVMLIVKRMLPLFLIFGATVFATIICTRVKRGMGEKGAKRAFFINSDKRKAEAIEKIAGKASGFKTENERASGKKSEENRQFERDMRFSKIKEKKQPCILRFFSLSGMKLALYAGGILALLVILGTAVLSGAAAKSQAEFKSSAVFVAVQDDDDTTASRELVKLVKEKATDSVRIIPCKMGEGETLMVDLKVEGLLVIGAGYEEALLSEAQIPLDYKSTASAFSAQAVREVFAGQVAAQRAIFRAYEQAGTMSGQALTDTDKDRLRLLITEAALVLPPVYQLSYVGGAGAPDPFVPDKMSFMALTVILILMTAAAYTGRRDARAVSARLTGSRQGRLLSYGADFMALTVLGVLASLCFLIPAGYVSLAALLASILLSLNMSAFSLMITRFTYGSGRVDGLAPLFTLLICLLGGCFLDISSLSDTARNLMSLSPAGGALLVTRGLSQWGVQGAEFAAVKSGVFGLSALRAAGVMAIETLLFIPLGMRGKK